MSPERRARVWLWLAWMASREADDLLYAYPRPNGWEANVERLEANSTACAAKANAVVPGATRTLWRWAVETFESTETCKTESA